MRRGWFTVCFCACARDTPTLFPFLWALLFPTRGLHSLGGHGSPVPSTLGAFPATPEALLAPLQFISSRVSKRRGGYENLPLVSPWVSGYLRAGSASSDSLGRWSDLVCVDQQQPCPSRLNG